MAEPIQTQLLLSVDKLFSTVLEDLTQGYTTAINIDVNQLPTDVCIYSKVRHKERTLGWTPWSPVMTFYIEVPSTWLTLWTSDTVKGYLRNIAANATEIVSTGYLYDEDQAIYRACILKLDKAGRVKWLRVLDIASTDGGVGIDTEGCIYVAINRINDTPVLTKWSPDGVCLWQQNLDIYQGTFYQVVVSDSNEVYTVGESSQDNTAIIVKWSTEATGPSWQRRLDNPGRIYFTDATIDTTGNIIAVGQIYYYGSWACGLLTKWSADGNLLWKKYVGGAKCCGVCTDSKNNIYCSGYYGTDTYVAMLFCLRSTGSAKWGRYLNNPVSNQEMFSLYDIVIDTDNNIYTVGGIKDTAYVLQWDSRGELQWEKAINCPDGYSFTQAVADDLGGIYATGFCVTAINIAGDGFGVLPMLTQYSWDEVDLTINSAKPGLYSLSNTSSVGTWDSVVLNLPIVELTIDLPSSTY